MEGRERRKKNRENEEEKNIFCEGCFRRLKMFFKEVAKAVWGDVYCVGVFEGNKQKKKIF